MSLLLDASCQHVHAQLFASRSAVSLPHLRCKGERARLEQLDQDPREAYCQCMQNHIMASAAVIPPFQLAMTGSHCDI
jgi:hypothetical protein